jgi:adenine-specific DNA-methyltransferase
MGLEPSLARGLSAYLNSTAVDQYFRQFNGHTQVNATDLRNLPYPSATELRRMGVNLGDRFPEQLELDQLLERELA